MKEIAFCVLIFVLFVVCYRKGRSDERGTKEAVVDIEVSKRGFDYLATVPNGKTITIKNSSGDYIMVIPDLKSFQEEKKI